MPSRMIREGLIDSDDILAAGELAEVLFTRLLLVVDDYGRFDGRVTVICRRCWPLGGPNEAEVRKRLDALIQHGVIVAYKSDGKPFIYIPKFRQRLRLKSPSKFPDPPGAPTNDGHVPDIAPTIAAHPPDGRSPEAEVEAKAEVKRKREAQSTVETGDSTVTAATAALLALQKLQPPTPPPEPLTLDQARIPEPAPNTPAAMLCSVLVANGIRAAPHSQQLHEWALLGVTVDRLKAAIAKARERKPAPQNIPLAYLEPIVLEPVQSPVDNSWRRDEKAAVRKGREVGIESRPGEELFQFVQRIDTAIAERARAQVQ